MYTLGGYFQLCYPNTSFPVPSPALTQRVSLAIFVWDGEYTHHLVALLAQLFIHFLAE